MAGSKKKVKQIKEPKGNCINQGGNPEQYYLRYPSWNFSSCDKEKWSLFSDTARGIFWNEILPHFQD